MSATSSQFEVEVGLGDEVTLIGVGVGDDVPSFVLSDTVHTCFVFPSLVFLSFSFSVSFSFFICILSFLFLFPFFLFSFSSFPATRAFVVDTSLRRVCSVAACKLMAVGILAARGS